MELLMTDDGANLIFGEIRALRHGQEALLRGQEALRVDIADVKISAREGELIPGLAMQLTGYLQLQIACQTSRIDRFEACLRRIKSQVDPVLS
jgi:hypothetical protein